MMLLKLLPMDSLVVSSPRTSAQHVTEDTFATWQD
jgi:hypothetical protein